MHTAYIGMGANLPSSIGLPDVTLAAASARLESLGWVFARSSLYSTAPIGYAEQPRFFNAAVGLKTELTPFELLGALLLIEKDFGRNRVLNLQNGPRTLDLDILLYGDFVIGGATLEIPHPRLAQRAFALVPLNEIAPAVADPRAGCNVSELLKSLFPASGNDLTSGHEIDAVVQIESEHWRACAGAADGPEP